MLDECSSIACDTSSFLHFVHKTIYRPSGMQKNLGKKKGSGGRKGAANKHGKGGNVTKKGELDCVLCFHGI